MVQAESVPIRVLEERHVADAGVEPVDELHPALLELGLRALEVVDVKGDRIRARVRRAHPERLRLNDLERQRARLPLAAGARAVLLRLLELEHLAVELLGPLEIRDRDRQEIDS